MATAIDEVAAFVASACSLTVGTTMFRHSMPDKPNACACVYEYPGLAPDFVLGQTAISTEYPRLQIAFRGAPNDHATPRALAETAYRACASASNENLSGTKYFELMPLQPPFKIRQDSNDRPVIGFSVAISKVLS
jgi:hypothetical protein